MLTLSVCYLKQGLSIPESSSLGPAAGGYALFGSETIEKAELLRNCLVRHFENEKARIADFSLNGKGMEVTVS